MRTRKTNMKENHLEASNIERLDTYFGFSERNHQSSTETAVASVDSSSVYSIDSKKVTHNVQNAAIKRSIVVSYKYHIGRFHINV